MLQLIISATLFITGLFTTEKPPTNNTVSVIVENCLSSEKDFPDPKKLHLLEKNTNLKSENERETT